jgi:galactokinase
MTSPTPWICPLVSEGISFDPARPTFMARAPGRLDLMGGNVDYTGGLVLQGLVAESIQVTVQTRKDGRVLFHNPGATQHGWKADAEFDVSEFDHADSLRHRCKSDPRLHWTAYVAGAVHLLRRRNVGLPCPAVQIHIESNLPPNKGVSSSAALTIATLKALSAAWGTQLAGQELAEAGQWIENEIVRSACGIMDHAAIVLGQQDQLLPMLCQPLSPGRSISLPPGICLWGIDSMVPRSTASVDYERARAAAFMAYKILCDRDELPVSLDTTGIVPRYRDPLWNGYLSNLRSADFIPYYEPHLPSMLSGEAFLKKHGQHADPFTSILPDRLYPVRGAARYAILEHERVQRFVRILSEPVKASRQEDQLLALGELMIQSHHAYRETGLASDRCDELVSMVQQADPQAGLYGAKMTGGGSGGTVAILGKPQGKKAIAAIAADYGRRYQLSPYVFAGSSPGADALGHASTTWQAS